MRELIVSEAPQPRVAAIVKAVVEELGGVVSEHTHTSTRFDHLRTDEDAWSRSGYIGTYQPFKQDRVRLRIRVWASWPRRLFYGFVFLGLIEAVIFFLMSLVELPPPPNVWILSAIFTFVGIAATLLMYSTSWAASQDLEDTLARDLGTAAQNDEEIPGDVYTRGNWLEHRQDLVDQAVARARAQRARQATTETVESGGLLQRVKRKAPLVGGGGDEQDEEDEEDDRPDSAAEPTDKEGEEADQARSWRDKIPFLGSKDAEPSEPDEEGSAQEEAAQEEAAQEEAAQEEPDDAKDGTDPGADEQHTS